MKSDIREIEQPWADAIAHEVQDKSIPSISYALLDREGILISGHATREDLNHPVVDESVFRVGSCSKMFTGIALMQFVEQGRVDLDEEVSEYIPGFAPHNPFTGADSSPSAGKVTLRKLMSHTSGLVREPSIGHYLDDSAVSMQALVEELKTSTLKEDPDGGVFQYSNAGISVVGYLVEQLAGTDFVRHIERAVLGPLGMHDSSFVLAEPMRDRLCPAFMWTFDEDIPAPLFDMGGGGAAGNLFSTIPDMARFVRAMLRGGVAESEESILSTGALHSMWEPIGRRGKAAYGLTFAVGELDGWRSVGHGGAVYGYATQLAFLPEADLGVVLCSTLDVTNGIIGWLGQYGLRLALAARGKGRKPDTPPAYLPLSEARQNALAGHFVDESSGEWVRVVSKSGRLFLLVDDLPLRLQARSETEFAVDGRAFGPGGEYPHLHVEFVSSEEGTPPGTLRWRDTVWKRVTDVEPEVVPDEYASFLGEYGPDFSITHIFYSGGKLKCTIEYFYTHTLERISERSFKMHGLLYDDETLEFDAHDEKGRTGIRVGPMFLVRRSGS